MFARVRSGVGTLDYEYAAEPPYNAYNRSKTVAGIWTWFPVHFSTNDSTSSGRFCCKCRKDMQAAVLAGRRGPEGHLVHGVVHAMLLLHSPCC